MENSNLVIDESSLNYNRPIPLFVAQILNQRGQLALAQRFELFNALIPGITLIQKALNNLLPNPAPVQALRNHRPTDLHQRSVRSLPNPL